MNEKEKKFNELKNDLDRWKWIIHNQDSGVVIYCDNDSTHAIIPAENDGDDAIVDVVFDDWIGNDSGIFILLEAMGIRASGV